MAGDPNLQINQNKPVPAPDNILHQFKNVTYKISLLSFKTYELYNQMAEQGSWEFMFNFVPSSCYTLMSSGGIPKMANDHLPQRHPKFELDFYISSLTMSGMMGMAGDTRATNIMDLSMAITEPVGTTLLDRLYEVLTEDGPNWTEKPMLVQIDFLGYDENDTPVRITPATRWIPVRLATLDFGISGQGTEYNVEFIAMAVLEGTVNPLTQSLNLKMIKGKKLTEILDNLAYEFNKEQDERCTDKGASFSAGGPRGGKKGSKAPGLKNAARVAPATQRVADRLVFKVAEGVNTPAASRLKNAEISPNVAKQTLLRKVPAGMIAALPPERRKGAAEQFKYESSTRYYGERGEYKIEFATPGQSMLAIVEKMIRDSTYITEQIAENTPYDKMADVKSVLKDPDKGLDWWKITYVKKLLDYDDLRNCYGKEIIVQIDPYKVVDPEVTGGKSKPGENGTRPPARSYEYIYSGQSVDIKNLDLTFNNAFLQAMTGLDTKNASSEEPVVKENKNYVSPDSGNKQDGGSSISGSSTIKPKSNKFIEDAHATAKQKTGATLMENLYRMPGSDMMTISLEIVGDPGYIQQDGILTMSTPNKAAIANTGTGHDPANGAILCDLDDTHFYLVFKTPRDYLEPTGLADFKSSTGGSTLSGFFRVWEVRSTFSGGEFSQTIDATRIYNQWRENINNPEKNADLMSAAEAQSYDFEDSKIAANALVAPGSAQAANEAAVGLDAFGGAGEAVTGAPLTDKEKAKNNELLTEARDAEGFSYTEFTRTETGTEVNFVDANADTNVIALQSKDINIATFRSAEARAIRLNELNNVAQVTTSTASQISSVPSNITPISLNPADAAGSVSFGLSVTSPSSTTSVTPTVRDNTGRVLYQPQGNPHGVVAINPTFNTSSYAFEDQKAISNNTNIERTERQNIIGSVEAGLAIGAAAAWARGNSASEDSKLRHGKYGNNYNSWKDNGYLIEILPVNPLTGQ